MKPWAIILTVMLVLLTALSSDWYIGRTAETLLNGLSELQQSLEGEEWAFVAIQTAAVEAQWRKVCPIWQMLINHREIDTIEQSLARLRKYAGEKVKVDSLGEIGVLMEIVGHIPEMNAAMFGNIF
ncbi:MAG: DUF4363 family protein [bacterium]|jgi:hypothetical protein